MAARRFAIDTSVLTQAHRQYYANDICPGFWKAVLKAHEDGRIISVDSIRTEIYLGNDWLKGWVRTVVPKSCFASTDDDAVRASYALTQEWARNQARFTGAARSKFAAVADAWLVAYAHANDYVVVSQEVSAPKSRSSVKIPDACIALGIEPISSFDMLRELGAAFH